jgi:uncharacterized protein (TIGR03067 family)
MGATYSGKLKLDASAAPGKLDLMFEEGPEKGNTSLGIYTLDGDRWTLCLTLAGRNRPTEFATKAGSGHALETLERRAAAGPHEGTAKKAARGEGKRGRRSGRGEPEPRTHGGDGKGQTHARPTGPAPPTGHARPTSPVRPEPHSPAPRHAGRTRSASGTDDPELSRLAGEWSMIGGEHDGHPIPDAFVKTGRRLAHGSETTVSFGGQVYLKATYMVDPSAEPATIDYAILEGPSAGMIQRGIYELTGDTLRVCFSTPGRERPSQLATKAGEGRTLAVWKRNREK